MDTPELIIVAATFLLAGAVKGVIGLGLPSVSLGILTAVAMVLCSRRGDARPQRIFRDWAATARQDQPPSGSVGQKQVLREWAVRLAIAPIEIDDRLARATVGADRVLDSTRRAGLGVLHGVNVAVTVLDL